MEQLFKAVLVIFYIVGMMAQIYIIGEPRKPLTPGVVAVNTLINAGILAGIIAWM
jgi:hypothetical protein